MHGGRSPGNQAGPGLCRARDATPATGALTFRPERGAGICSSKNNWRAWSRSPLAPLESSIFYTGHGWSTSRERSGNMLQQEKLARGAGTRSSKNNWRGAVFNFLREERSPALARTTGERGGDLLHAVAKRETSTGNQARGSVWRILRHRPRVPTFRPERGAETCAPARKSDERGDYLLQAVAKRGTIESIGSSSSPPSTFFTCTHHHIPRSGTERRLGQARPGQARSGAAFAGQVKSGQDNTPCPLDSSHPKQLAP